MNAKSPENVILANQSRGVKLAEIPKVEELRDASSSDIGIFADSSNSALGSPNILHLMNDLYDDNMETTDSFEIMNPRAQEFIQEVADTISSIVETVCSTDTFGSNLANEETEENDDVNTEEPVITYFGQLEHPSVTENRVDAAGGAINGPVKKKVTVRSVKKALTMKSNAPKMVLESLQDFGSSGATYRELISHMDEKYGIHARVMKRRISQALKKSLKKGKIIRFIGDRILEKREIVKITEEVRFKIVQKENPH